MAYHVLARKWRPRSFATMVGQQHVLRALINALDHQRLHHAYLFTGTRGVGKTTIARIFAKSLNCERGVSSTPCGECASCKEIDEGRFVDLIEVDAASRTGVDDTRELLENVQYTPSRGRYKVYLIDEVHMFSKSSFNALLKTLEEPPPHVKFLLATTDPQKLPATVLSRCLQFNLKRLPLELIRDHLGAVLSQEEVPFQTAALVLLARAADGSMRDGLSLLDQAIAFGAGRVDEEDVRTMLGSIDQDHAFGLLEALAAGDANQVLHKVDDLAQRAPDYDAWLAETITLLQRIALAQQVPEAIDDALGDRERVLTLATGMGAEDVQLYYQIGLIGRRDLPLSPEPRSGFEMVLLRMLAFRPSSVAPAANVPASSIGESTAPSKAAPRASTTGPGVQSMAQPAPTATQAQQPPPRQPAVTTNPVATSRGGGGRFDQMRSLLGNKGKPNQAVTPTMAKMVPAGSPAMEPVPEPNPTSAVVQTAWTTVEEVDRAPPGGPDQGSLTRQPPPVAAHKTDQPLDWLGLMPTLGLSGMTRQLASHCAPRHYDGKTLVLVLETDKAGLLGKEREEKLQQALCAALAPDLRVRIETGAPPGNTPAIEEARGVEARLQAARQAIDNDLIVHTLKQRFGARVDPDSVRPVACGSRRTP